jgi:hypothetical protein
MKTINTNKGLIAPVIALIVVLIIAGIWYATSRKGTPSDVASSTPITLISPNGGETLTIGATTTVTFKTNIDLKDNYRVVVWLEEGAAPLAVIPATSTTHSFVIPESILIGGDAMAPLMAGSYKFRVTLHDGEPCTGHCLPSDVKELGSDSSDTAFTIGTSTAKTATTSPITN